MQPERIDARQICLAIAQVEISVLQASQIVFTEPKSTRIRRKGVRMEIPGILMRLIEPREAGQHLPYPTLVPPAPSSGIDAAYILSAIDDEKPSRNTIYFLNDITPILASSSGYDSDVKAHGDDLASLSWVICAFINGRDKSTTQTSPESFNTLQSPPTIGSVLVVNGNTPRPDKEQEYNDWYDQEHGEKLVAVPGWNSARRYQLAKFYGDTETATFYGCNFYDEENGLGGPEWKAGVTEWTVRIRSNSAKPNLRRVWKVVGTRDNGLEKQT